MNRCPSCDYRLPTDREEIGARCPNCCDPLYEPPGHVSHPVREDESACALHTGRETVGTCGRCGNYFCAICRTRWREQFLCAACAERVLISREATPEQARAHFRQALLGLLMGLGAWCFFLLGQLLIVSAIVAVQNPILFLLGLLLLVASVLLGVAGTGQATAALRTRGSHMILATSGFLIDGLFLGVFIGNYVLRLWIT